MRHLLFDELYYLSKIASEGNTFNAKEIELLNHLKLCKECYEQFCVLMTLNDVTNKPMLYSEQKQDQVQNDFNQRILTAVKIAIRTIKNTITTEINQLNGFNNQFVFERNMAFAVRGNNIERGDVDFYEEIDNEQTYIAIDKDKRIVRLQIDTQTLDCTELKIYIMTEGSKRKLDIQKVGNLITSTFNLEDNSIDLIIEK